MANDTRQELGRQMIYSMFIRNHTPEGTFQAAKKDLERIAALGTDIVWLMPIHPLGEKARKGVDGSPYANRDYRAIEPSFGTREDLEEFVSEAHRLNMKVIIDVVYNHTSPDSVLFEEHPEWFYKDADGNPCSIVKHWSDIIELDYSQPELWDYLIDTLKYWSGIVDGFRCDVASRIPLEFWKKARKETQKVNPDIFWLAESVHQGFVKFVRDQQRYCASDCELYEAFDAEYPYDMWHIFDAYIKGEVSLSRYIEELERQETAYPLNYIKVRCLENHDNQRIASKLSSDQELKNWTAFNFFLKGMPMIYEGSEWSNVTKPDFFTKELVQPQGEDISSLIAALMRIKHEVLPASGRIFFLPREEDVVEVLREGNYGLFQLKDHPSRFVRTSLPDGEYVNEIDGHPVEIKAGQIERSLLPLIVKTSAAFKLPEKADAEE